LQVNNCLNSTAVRNRVEAIQDSIAVKAMLAGFKRRPAGWRTSDCKLVTFDNLMKLTIKVVK
jgi:hypothetical protein